MQILLEFNPITDENVPTWHGRHKSTDIPPEYKEKVPAEQSVHCLLPF
jgi:hypothetical protein